MASRVPWAKKKLDDDLPGSAVREQYDSRINKFLHQVDEPGLGWLQSHGFAERPKIDLLNNLFTWGDKVYNERNRLQFELTQAQERIQRLQNELADTNRRLNMAQNENRNMKDQHRGELESIKSKHSTYVQTLESKHSTVVEREKDIHGREVKKLVGQLLVNQDDNMAWTDDKLKFRFQQIQNLISSLVSPRSKEFRPPPDVILGRDLDPTDFLTRTTKSKVHFLLQSTIWNILCEQFFSAPFGFGVLGQGPPQEKLFDVYFAWIRLLGEANRDGDASFDSFQNSKFINNWRSAMFQCIHESFMKTSNQPNASEAPIAAMMRENVDNTTRRIILLLIKISKLSGSSVSSNELEGKVRQITDQAQGMALQFGVNQAQMQLLMPKSGDQVQIGTEVHDCEDGDCDRGSRHLVDLVTLPGLQKFGDGLSDMQSKMTLVPCEIYPT